jgi:hypothetical protein
VENFFKQNFNVKMRYDELQEFFYFFDEDLLFKFDIIK